MQHLFQALAQMDRKINGEEYVRWDSVSNVINIFVQNVLIVSPEGRNNNLDTV